MVDVFNCHNMKLQKDVINLIIAHCKENITETASNYFNRHALLEAECEKYKKICDLLNNRPFFCKKRRVKRKTCELLNSRTLFREKRKVKRKDANC